MQAIQLTRFGRADEVLHCVDVPAPPAPGEGEVAVRMMFAPINPSDLLQTSGRYGAVQPTLPFDMGREGVGRVTAVGAGVTALAVGDLVVPILGPTWRTDLIRKPEGLVKLPQGIDAEQAAMLKANPATAALMLREIVPLKAGDWVIQNAANSAVGTYLVRLASKAGIRTLNLVRRAEAGAHLTKLPGAVVIAHEGGPSHRLAAEIQAATGGAPVKLGIDAIGGPATEALARALAEGGTIASYGLLSGKPCEIEPRHLIFRLVTLRGFWVSKWLETSKPAAIQALYSELAERIADGTLAVEIAGRYPFSRIGEAAAHAGREARGGKVLIHPD
jgi:NADPH:quinone reductase-like Zn-dependent oxidoreductase